MMNKDFKFFICDFETTGLDFRKDYPIEIGGMFTDSDFNILGTYRSLIKFSRLVTEITENNDQWPEKYLGAYKVHKIDASVISSETNSYEDRLIGVKPPHIIAEQLYELCSIYNKGKRKVIIVSDNAQFEFWFMKKIFEDSNVEFPFHYCAWDTSMLLELSGVGDPSHTHRAFTDATSLYQALVRARERLNLF